MSYVSFDTATARHSQAVLDIIQIAPGVWTRSRWLRTPPPSWPGPASLGAAANGSLELTLVEESDGPLTKTIKVNGSGVLSDGSDCRMARGTARRTSIATIEEFAELTANLTQNQAWVMGALRDGLPDEVRVITKVKLKQKKLNDVIARTTEYLIFRPGRPALLPIDFDSKGMPPEVAEKLKGGLVEALTSILPDIATTARVMRRSTSRGLRRTGTGEGCPGSDSLHLYLMVADGADIGRALRVLHDRCWLVGLGWIMPSRSGAVLERSAVDPWWGCPSVLFLKGLLSSLRRYGRVRSGGGPAPGQAMCWLRARACL